MIHALTAVLALWGHEPTPAASVPFARKYALSISGTPGKMVRLQAGGLPARWVASFCTPHLCAPGRVTIVIPRSGRFTTELQIIPTDPQRSVASPIRVNGSDGRQSFSVARVSRGADSIAN
ncbi:MAG: hypothetical protein M3126_04515 [Candidatus Eremiobacteraeota bacterium]|nr:hypothetical protein [Candidatus Eremiobacteraeota bacterium]